MIMFWSPGQEKIGVEFVGVTVIHAERKNQSTQKITEGIVSLICQRLAAAVALITIALYHINSWHEFSKVRF